jgi:Calx-beta domain
MRFILLATCLAIFGQTQVGYSLTDEQYKFFGRSYLGTKDLPNALAMFSSASDAEAKTLKALTSLALLQRDSGTVTFLNNLYVDSPANIWDARDAGYSPNPSQPNPLRAQNNANVNQIAGILRNNHLPVYLQAETDLSAFTSDSLLVPLGRSETGYPDISLDRGDILMIRALLACGRGAAYLINSQNSNILINEFISLTEEPGPVTIEKFLAKFPDAAKLATPSDLPLARQEFKNSITLYKQASEWVRTKRALNTVRLFNLPGSFGVNSGEVYTAGLADEVNFRAKLDEYALILDGSRLLTGFDNQPIDTLNAKPFFDGHVNLRSILPSFRKNKIRQGEVTDTFAKAGGIYPANTIARTESWLLGETRTWPADPYSFGLFVPPHLSITTPTGNSLIEGYQPPDAFLALGYSEGYYGNGLGLFWINPQTGGFSKLNSQPVISDSLFMQQTWVSDSSIYIKSDDFSTWPERVTLSELSQVDGHLIRTIALSEIITFSNGYQLIEGGSDFFVILNSNIDRNWHIYRLNKSTLALQEVNLGITRLSYFSWNSATLDQSKECIWLAGGNENTSGTCYFKFRISDGELLQTIPNVNLSGLHSVVAGKNGIIAVKVNWPTCSLISINYATGIESVLNPDLFSGRQIMSWTSKLKLDSSGDNVFLSSVDWNWENPILHKFSTLNGQTLANYVIGQAGKFSYFWMIAPTSGSNTFCFRTGDVSEPISVSFSLKGTASNALDYTFPTTSFTFQPGNSQQPIPFGLVNDNVVEFDENVVLTGTPNPESNSTVQPFTLTILDDDGSGIGIFATDNQGKEGRMNPDPFGFRIGVYDPLRFEVRRTGSTASAISVKVSRDALLSSASTHDYEITGFDVDGQSVRIPAGSSLAEILVSPKYDINYPEGTESLTLKISPDPAYTMMEYSSATGSIADSSPYEWWSYQMGVLISNQSPSLDTDMDGMPNLLEMALGRDPNLADSPDAIKEGIDSEGYLTLTYKRWTGGTISGDGSYAQYGVTYRPQASSTLELADWSSSSIQVLSTTDTGDGMEEVVVRDTQSKSQPRRFMRISVTL